MNHERGRRCYLSGLLPILAASCYTRDAQENYERHVYGVDGSGDVRESLVYVYETLSLMGTQKQRRGSRSVLGELDRTASRVMPFGSRPGTKGEYTGRRSMCCREWRLEGQPEKTSEVSSEVAK
jgi:hypothetical protein